MGNVTNTNLSNSRYVLAGRVLPCETCAGQRELLDAAEEKVTRLRELLEACAWQWGIRCKNAGRDVITTGGLSTLEDIFDILGWSDPQPITQNKDGYWQALREALAALKGGG
jgi:hypothetical protein